MKRIFIAALLAASLMACTRETEARHTCNMTDCDKLDNPAFQSDYEPDTDGYLFDLLHYRNPDLSYEQLEAAIWGEGNKPAFSY